MKNETGNSGTVEQWGRWERALKEGEKRGRERREKKEGGTGEGSMPEHSGEEEVTGTVCWRLRRQRSLTLNITWRSFWNLHAHEPRWPRAKGPMVSAMRQSSPVAAPPWKELWPRCCGGRGEREGVCTLISNVS